MIKMNENEKTPAEMRILTAEPEQARYIRKKSSAKSAFISIAALAVAAAYQLPPEKLKTVTDTLQCSVSAVSMMSAKLDTLSGSELTAFFDRAFPVRNTNESSETAYTNIDLVKMRENDILMLSEGSRRMPSSANEEAFSADFLPPPEADDSTAYPESFSTDRKVTAICYESGQGENYIDLTKGGQIRNVTLLTSEEIRSEVSELPDFRIKLNAPENEPQILIMHTHTTESYQPAADVGADPVCRTTDSKKNMTAVGNAMADVFEKEGIRVIHDTTVHDHPSYNGSYDRSRETVSSILEKYPSIKIVLDVHRDAIERESGEIIAPTAVINGKSCAQVMIISGCDDGTMDMPDFRQNLRTAALFQQYMEMSFKGLTRPVLFDYRSYNQNMTHGSLLIEVGGHGNTLDEAVYAGELAAKGISEAIKSELSAEE